MTEHLDAIGIQKNYKTQMIACEVCDSSDFSPLQTYGRIGEPGHYGALPVLICKKCGYKQINPRYEENFYLDYYEELYRKVSFGESDAVPSETYLAQQTFRGDAVRKWVEQVEGPAAGRRSLDHGCASGATMLSWRDNGWDPVGIDPHRPSVELGKERFKLDIRIAAGESLPFPDADVDLILSLGSLEHVYDMKKTMLELRRVLRSGGALVIRWRSDVIFASPLEYYNHNHYRYFSRTTLRLLLKRYGFDVVKETDQRLEGWDSYEYTLARLSGEPMASDVLLAHEKLDDAAKIIDEHCALRHEFAERCRQFLQFANQPGRTAEEVVKAVREGSISWRGLLGGEAAAVVKRAVMEADRYLREVELHPDLLNSAA